MKKGFLTFFIVLFLLEVKAQYISPAPTIDGNVSVSEYGGTSNNLSNWFITWDATNLYIGLTGSNTSEGAVLYLDINPQPVVNGGSNSNGSLAGQNYDGTNFTNLPFRADFVAYFKNGYREYRTADGSGAWGSNTTGFGTYADNGSTIRELAIPWSAITGGSIPASFNWFGYVTSGGGYGYNQLPSGNPSGTFGTSATAPNYFTVTKTADGNATPPFNQLSYATNTGSSTLHGTYWDFTLNGSGVTLDGTHSISGTLNMVNSGSLTIGSNSLNVSTVSGNGVLTGSTTSNLNLELGASSILYFDQTIPGTTNVLNNLNLNSPGSTFSIANPLNVVGVITPTAGSLGSNGSLTLVSNATGTASVATGGASYAITGGVYVQQYIPGGFRNYRFLSHPFNSTQSLSQLTGSIDITGSGGINGFTPTATNNPSAFYFNTTHADGHSPSDGGWTAFTSANGSGVGNIWNVGEGIIVLVRGTKGQGLDGSPYTPNPVTLTMLGVLNTGSQTIILKTGGTGATAGFNLVGNPYPSPLDIGTAITNANSVITAITPTVYTYNPQTSGYTTGVISGNYILPAYASYFVQALSFTSLNFTESSKSTCSIFHTCPTVFGSNNVPDNAIQFKVTDGAGLQWDNMYVIFNSNNSSIYEKGKDAVKMTNALLNLYSISSDNQNLAVDYRKLDGQTIPLGLNIAAGTGVVTYTITASDFTVNGNYDLYLFDKLTSTFTKLIAGASYNVTVNSADSTTYGNSRLAIVMKASTTATAIDPAIDKFIVKIAGNPVNDNIIVKYAAPKADNTSIRLINSSGQIISNLSLGIQQTGQAIIPVKQFSSGLYVVEVEIGNDKVSKKVIKN